MKLLQLALQISAFVLAIGVSALPRELHSYGLWVMLVGFFTIVGTAYRSSFRQHRHGILAQWSDPSSILMMRLSEGERQAVGIGMAMMFGAGLGYILRLV